MSTISQLRAVLAHLREHGVKPPPHLARGIVIVEASPEAVQERLAAAVVARVPALAALSTWSTALCPSYPRASTEAQARIALGEPPSRVLRGLSPREAHEALSAGVSCAVDWILRDVPAHGVTSLPVARWLAACWSDPERRAALETERTERIAGAEVRGRLLDRVDEIDAPDLRGVTSGGVQPVFERAAARLYAQWESSAQNDKTLLAPTPRWWRPVRCAHLLQSASALCAEGRALHHCVGTYAGAVRSERSAIVAIRIRTRDTVVASTVELSRDGRTVRQHRGPSNATPHPLCVAALKVLRRRWGVA